MGATLEPIYKEIIKLFSDRAIANRGVTKADRGFQEIYDSFMNTVGGQHITDISTTTRYDIMTVINRNQDKGVAVISKAITDRMSPKFTRARASTIARTETHSASSFASHEQFKAFNEPTMMKRWVANADERTRPSHYAVSGTEIGIDDTFSVAGKLMKYTGDPAGGASEIINCRCVTIYFESDDVFVDGETEVQQPDIPAQDAVLRRRATSDTVNILTRAKALRALSVSMKAGAEDTRYPRGERRFNEKSGSKRKYGEVTGKIATDATEETLSSVVVIMDELNELADIMHVPKLRGIATIRSNGKAIANMGDGVIGIKVQTFNRWSSGVGKPKISKAEAEKAKIEYDEKRSKIVAERNKISDDVWDRTKKSSNPSLYDHYTKAELKRWDEIEDELKQIAAEYRLQSGAISNLNTSSWKFGGKLKDRPSNGFQYYDDGYDRIRNTMLHEFGHQVHQQYKVSGSIDRYYGPHIESGMSDIKRRVAGASTKYGDTNSHEWFAENFALWADSKLDLVDPRFKIIIKKIINDQEVGDVI
tara:strand:+ start:2326 stop:3930 length:1605 start_codon:yes stop_codon:yes gene_type:complete